MPLLPLLVLRILEGLAALVCFGGILFGFLLFAILGSGGLEVMGISLTLERVAIGTLACAVGVLWFGTNAIRGESTPSGAREP